MKTIEDEEREEAETLRQLRERALEAGAHEVAEAVDIALSEPAHDDQRAHERRANADLACWALIDEGALKGPWPGIPERARACLDRL